jgi:hypothetical protein
MNLFDFIGIGLLLAMFHHLRVWYEVWEEGLPRLALAVVALGLGLWSIYFAGVVDHDGKRAKELQRAFGTTTNAEACRCHYRDDS